MADVVESVLQYLEKADSVDSVDLANHLNVDHQKVVGAIKSIQSLGEVINAEQKVNKSLELTDEGKEVVEHGSHEARVFKAVPEQGIAQNELMETGPYAKIGFSKAMQAGWITMDKSAEGGPKILKKVDSITDKVQECLQLIRDLRLDGISEKDTNDFKKRKLVQEVKFTSYVISKGSNFSSSVSKQEVELTPEMISKGTWKEKSFKEYNFNSLGVMPPCGHLHPLLKVRAEYRQIFLEMGFTEMPTNNFIESSFWNFDSLFQPQQHPARDAHDTFFISDPANAHEFPMEYLEKVRQVHSKGGYGSQGYGYDWSLDEAKKNLLRTHTTAVTARMLYKAAQQKPFKPVKYFSIDRVFRNENLDDTHLAEFHQIEGVVADYGLTLGDLIGTINAFFMKLGLKKLVEIGNSGIFRPEMLLPMGLPEGVTAIAWGLSLERPTMIKYKVSNIRDLIGPKVDLQMVYDNPVCRLDK
ncbi:phenylalanine--tRNA ligase alpha subunit-like isoform X8 [Dreissena polymorpha]|uniref:phenylalanine--tRNA ligase alpha subunit-like isoform X7 n=1 Tax=Dreissena polymorpha TaxID=45954 RepID=UPI0022642E1B|nr:phenylalanine--tRNA ligase alpha subunit-like isoform X7 [Dreissena polymorpha]XP_052229625.1 phenylalanine--tRNA ligase alpha subunit-like isoform X8 [Dreissena polymorpha]